MNVLNTYSQSLCTSNLNSTPNKLFEVFDEANLHRPQPKIDVPNVFPLSGMQIKIGGIKSMSRGKYFRCTVLTDNLGIGSASSAIWTSELLNEQNMI